MKNLLLKKKFLGFTSRSYESNIDSCLCGTSNIGIQILLNSMVAFFPAAGDTCNSIIVENIDTHEEDIIGFNESLPPSLFIFKNNC